MAIALGVSWVSWFTGAALGATVPAAAMPLQLVGAFGPLAGTLVLRFRRARRGEPAPEHVVRTRLKNVFWTPLMLVLVAATVLTAALLADVAGGPTMSAHSGLQMITTLGPAAFLATMLVGGPVPEEPGWRGTAYPRMRASMGRVQAGPLCWASSGRRGTCRCSSCTEPSRTC